MVTHTADTALATRAGGGSQIGATLSGVAIPTSGVVRVTVLEAEFDETGDSADAIVAIALDVAGTKVWATADEKDGNSHDLPLADIDSGVSSMLIGTGVGSLAGSIIRSYPVFSVDIVAHSLPTGDRDIKIYMGDEANGTTGAATLTGTTVTCRILVEIIDTST